MPRTHRLFFAEFSLSVLLLQGIVLGVVPVFEVENALAVHNGVPVCNGLHATIWVNSDNNNIMNGTTDTGVTYTGTLNGTSGADVIVGTSGNDTINGGGQDDTICGGDGNDTINGDNGSDWIDGEGGNDTVDGGNGRDTLFGGSGDDIIRGGNGGDMISGGPGLDFCNGNSGPSIVDCESSTGQGIVVITKNTIPDDAQDFAFTGGLGSFSLDDDANETLSNTRTFNNQSIGSFAVTESSVTGWNLTGLMCTDPDSETTTSLETRTATIDLDEAEVVSCLYTNTCTDTDGDQICDVNDTETCDGVDNDGDGQVDEGFNVGAACSVGVGACSSQGVFICTQDGLGTECNATPGSPAPDDSSCNGIDDDCSGQTDEDYTPQQTTCGVGACSSTGQTSCVAGDVENSCTPGQPAADDATCNGIDEDCNGTNDEDYVAPSTACGTGQCSAAGVLDCVNGSTQDTCTPGSPSTEICDAVDNDCDAQTDEGFNVGNACSVGTGACQANGFFICSQGGTTCDATPGTPTAEVCDGIDNDCDGIVDNDADTDSDTLFNCADPDDDGDGYSDTDEANAGSDPLNPASTPEICDGIDNDLNDGIDEGFPDTDGDGTADCVDQTPNGDLPPGTDYFETPSGATTWQIPQDTPIPADFFGDGCEPFAGSVPLQGVPITPGDTADTVVQRNGPVNLPDPLPSSGTVPIEIVALSLHSVAPITVTCPGGPTLWDVRVDLSPSLSQPPGSMTVKKTHGNGGTFDATLPVVPRFVFTPVGGGVPAQFDAGTPTSGQNPYQFLYDDAPWTFEQCFSEVLRVPGMTSNMCAGATDIARVLTGGAGGASQWPMKAATTDLDKDTIGDPVDNCVSTPNTDQADADHDGRGDVCDDVCDDGVDNDGDNLTDIADPGCYNNGNVATGIFDPNHDDEVHTPECVNGVVDQPSEECDDGNSNNTDACTNACLYAVCGDGYRQAGETCDDGNTNPGDGCTANCALVDGWFCSDDEPNVCSPVCGDGQIEGSETCDDGGTEPNDGCSATCQEEIACSPTDQYLVGYWKGDENTGSSAADSTTINNVGALQNGTAWSTDTPVLAFTSTSAFSFDGINDYVLVNDTTNVPTGSDARSIALWLKQDTIGNQATLVSLGNGNTGNQRFIVQVSDVGGTYYLFTDGINGGNNISISGGEVPSTGAWHHIAFTMDGFGNWKYYLDGSFVKGGTFPVAIDTMTNKVEIGSRHDSATGYFDGLLDEVRVYGRVLSAGDVADLYGGQCDPQGGQPDCGNNAVEPGEQCDDGDLENDDGCSNSCAVESGWTCQGNPSACATICGDSLVRGLEQCDDGNTLPNDYCSPSCMQITGFCDDFVTQVTAGETCDEGPALNGTPLHCNDTCNDTTTPLCGNAVVEPPESCDDGSDNGMPLKCNLECSGTTSPTCGNGTTESIEDCDDGNQVSSDGCSSSCLLEDGYQCSGQPSTCELVCSNGVIDAGEECDDDNLTNNDGCSSTCVIESGYACVNSPPPSICALTCGDGDLDAGETCDDGNTAAGDGCSSVCLLEQGSSSCPAGPMVGHWPLEEHSGTTAADLTGGNDGTLEGGTVQAGAGAFVGSTDALTFDGSDDIVRVANPGDFSFPTTEFTVSLFAKSTVGNRSVLGNYNGKGWGLYFYSDGRVNFFGYGNGGANDNAFPGGVLDGAWHHIAGVYKRSGASLTIDTYVDGVLIGSNTAAVGDITSGSDLLFGRYLLQPHFDGMLDEIRVYDHVLTAGEIADLAGGCNDGPAVCGNSITEAGETCDDGNLSNSDGCSATCQEEGGYQCSGTPSLCDGICGDALIRGSESCDDGNTTPSDGCSAMCTEEQGWDCVGEPSECELLCGNGQSDPGEACDDGNKVNDDECTDACTLPSCGDSITQQGEACDDGNLDNTDACTTSCMFPICNDGFAQPSNNEECDDANQTNEDGCTNVCLLPVCGDGFQQPGSGEICDEGQLNGAPLHCNLTCNGTTPAVCGNSIVELGEQCDDGNLTNTDSCPSTCQNAVCGDGFLRSGVESCDDGNTANGDGCSSVCAIEPPDTDGDGQTDQDEVACGSNPNDPQSLSPDLDGDHIPDCVDPDDDGDGFADVQDNCPLVANPGQEDLDQDGIGDACDPQTCGNGRKEGTERCDDGNTASGDGCSFNACTIETGYACVNLSGNPNTPSMCVIAPICNGQQATIFVDSTPGSPTIFGGLQSGFPYGGTLNGTAGPDVMVGTEGNDRINGFSGNDLICALGGNDIVDGGSLNDTIFGGAGDDNLSGGSANDLIIGGPGADTIDGGSGNDIACGGTGNDVVKGSSGNDKLDGQGGTDNAQGSSGTDTCSAETRSSCEIVAAVAECASY
jgi:cysteine-rich repeat protein